MRLYVNAVAAPIPGEQEIGERLQRLTKRQDGTVVGTISVQNLAGEHRLKVVTHTQAEHSGARRLLEDRKFTDALDTYFEEVNEDGDIEGGFRELPEAEIDSLTNGGEFSDVFKPSTA